MFLKKIKHKDFDYLPRFYNPENDNELKRKKELSFRTNLVHTRARGKRSIVFWIVIIIFIIYFYLSLS